VAAEAGFLFKPVGDTTFRWSHHGFCAGDNLSGPVEADGSIGAFLAPPTQV